MAAISKINEKWNLTRKWEAKSHKFSHSLKNNSKNALLSEHLASSFNILNKQLSLSCLSDKEFMIHHQTFVQNACNNTLVGVSKEIIDHFITLNKMLIFVKHNQAAHYLNLPTNKNVIVGIWVPNLNGLEVSVFKYYFVFGPANSCLRMHSHGQKQWKTLENY